MCKFIYSEKAKKFCEIFPLLLTVFNVVKSKGKISQNFVAFTEYMNFPNLLGRMDGLKFLCFPWFPENSLLCVILCYTVYLITFMKTYKGGIHFWDVCYDAFEFSQIRCNIFGLKKKQYMYVDDALTNL